MSSISIESCVFALNSAAFNRRRALQLEMSVGLAVFSIEGAADKESKAILYGAYASAGYDCLKPEGADYKTINRRVNTSAALFEKITPAAVLAWIGRAHDGKAIERIAEEIETLGFQTINDVKAYCDGKPVQRKKSNVVNISHHRRRDDVEFVYHVETKHLHFGVPAEVTAKELILAAQKLFALADEIAKRNLKAA